MYTTGQAYELAILALYIWREARNGDMAEKYAAGRRASHDRVTLIEIPRPDDPLFFDCLMAAKHLYDGTAGGK